MNLFASFNSLYNPATLQAQVKQLQTPLSTPPKIDAKTITANQRARGEELTASKTGKSAELEARFAPKTSTNTAPQTMNGYVVPANYQSFLDTGYL